MDGIEDLAHWARWGNELEGEDQNERWSSHAAWTSEGREWMLRDDGSKAGVVEEILVAEVDTERRTCLRRHPSFCTYSSLVFVERDLIDDQGIPLA